MQQVVAGIWIEIQSVELVALIPIGLLIALIVGSILKALWDWSLTWFD